MEIRREILGSPHGNLKKSREGLDWSNSTGPSRLSLRKPLSMICKSLSLILLHFVGYTQQPVFSSYLHCYIGLNPDFFYYLYQTISMSEINQSVLSPELQELQSKLKETTFEMEQHAKEGKYVLAESCRANAEKLKKELEGKKVVEVERRQKKENREIKKYLKDELLDFAKEWEVKLYDYSLQTAKWVVQLIEKQAKEREEARSRLEDEIPEKCKDSSECLNLRKIQAGLAKQHNYIQALKVQKQVKEMEKKQQQTWLKFRSQKVELGLEQLKQRQQVETKALEKRIESGKCELQLEKEKAEAKLVHKHANVSKDIQSQNKKEFLATKGEFKTRVDVLSPTRSRLLSPSSRSKLFTSTR